MSGLPFGMHQDCVRETGVLPVPGEPVNGLLVEDLDHALFHEVPDHGTELANDLGEERSLLCSDTLDIDRVDVLACKVLQNLRCALELAKEVVTGWHAPTVVEFAS